MATSMMLYDVLSDYSLSVSPEAPVDKVMSDPAYRWDAGRFEDIGYTDDRSIVRSGWIGTHRKSREIHYFVEVIGDEVSS